MSHKADMKPLQGSGQLSHDYNFLDAEDSVSEWQSFVAVFKGQATLFSTGKAVESKLVPKSSLQRNDCSAAPVARGNQ
jgi:hypothetical protein